MTKTGIGVSDFGWLLERRGAMYEDVRIRLSQFFEANLEANEFR